jgi:hypothetical protein
MDIKLDEGPIPNAAEAVDLTGLDDEDVTRPGFEFLSVDGPETAAFPHELDFVVRMTMGPRTTARESADEEHGDVDITVVGPDEVMRAAMKWQFLLTNAVHPGDAPMVGVGAGPSNSNLGGFPGKPRRRDRRARTTRIA